MNDQCDRFRLQLAPALFGDLDERERADLQSHLHVCPDCRAEKAELEQTLGVLQSTQDVEVPRHFFVYDSGLFWSPLGWLQQLSRVGKGAVLMAVGAVLLAVGLALSEVQIRVKEGAVTLAFGQLPPEQREVLEMAFFRGMTQSEIANQTGIPLGTVKTRSLLAMRKLRKAMAEDIEELL